uniref:CCHC-type domain-containing protein n=1 Tax=Cannabis sativa TaxID=3483 RepID=A0A803P9N1_CANSA
MAKKRRIVRKPVLRWTGQITNEEKRRDVDDLGDSRSEEGLNLIAEVVSASEIDQIRKEQELFQESARLHWNSFSKEKIFSRDSKLTFTKPLMKNRVKIAQIDPEEVAEQAINWNSTVICMVLGAKPLLGQSIDYEWLAVKCKSCSRYGHIMADCRKGGNEKSKPLGQKVRDNTQKAPVQAAVTKTDTRNKIGDPNGEKKPTKGQDTEWIIPKKPAMAKQSSVGKRRSEEDNDSNNSGNSFGVLKSKASLKFNKYCIERGPDGYGSSFFKVMWKDIGADICEVATDFFSTGTMPKEFRAILITVIPKHDNPSRVEDYKPIAYCTTVYKCISKLMCLRLSTVLPSLVSQN